MGPAKTKNKPPFWKRRYLVQKTYQIRYSFLIAGIGALSLILAFYSIRYIVSMDLLPLSVPNINLYRVSGFMFISWFFLGVIYTHTTAGPVTQLITQIDNIAKGEFENVSVRFRRGDDLQDLPEYFNNMVKVLKFRSKEESVLIKEIEAQLAQIYDQKSQTGINVSKINGAVNYSIQRIQNLITKKQRYLGAPSQDLTVKKTR